MATAGWLERLPDGSYRLPTHATHSGTAELLRSDGLPSPTAGQSLSQDAFKKYWQRELKGLGLNGDRYENTLHGLRKNPTINLLEAGCTNSQVKAIIGHSIDLMVNLYSEKVN